MPFHKDPLTPLTPTGGSFLPEEITLAAAQGSTLTGSDGTDYLDFTGGRGAALLGYNHPRLVSALQAQLAHVFPHPAGLFLPAAIQELAAALLPHLPAHLDRLHPGDSGAASLAQAIALARQFTGRAQVITLGDSPSPAAGRLAVPYPDPAGLDNDWTTATAQTLSALRALLRDQVAPAEVAALVAPATNGPAGGWTLPPDSFWRALHEFCDEQRLLLILDERETAGGRTGRVLAAAAAARPDLLVLGGGLMAGLPLGLLVLPEALTSQGLPAPAGGEALGAVAAAATLAALVEEDLPAVAHERGAQVQAGLEAWQAVYPFFGAVRGAGLWRAVAIGVPGRGPDADLALRIQEACVERGLLLPLGGPAHNVLAWLPPLVVTPGDIDAAFAILDDALEEIFED